MAKVNIKIPGSFGETKTSQLHHAVANHWAMVMEEKDRAARTKPKPVQRRTFAHLRDYRDVIK